MMKKFCMSYSCGKDSTLALYRMIEQGNEPVALIVSIDESMSRSWFHGVSSEILNSVSISLGIPLIEARCRDDNYEQVFINALEQARNMGAAVCAFGDIDIDEHRKWGEEKCKLASIDATFPLWQENRLDITKAFMQAGFKSCIKTVSKQFQMSRDFLGKTLTPDLVQEIIDLGIDPCGENGEYHTFCYDGPIFRKPIETKIIGVYESEYSFSLHIKAM